MTTVDVAIPAIQSLQVEQTVAESSLTLPPGAETLAVLELGDGDDSSAFIRSMASRGVFNVTPPSNPRWTKLPTPLKQRTTFFKAAPPDWWLDRFVSQDPIWVYLSGHYTGFLYNSPKNFKLDFVNPSEDSNALWQRWVTSTTFHLADRCEVVIVIGCSAISTDNVDATRNITLMLTPIGGNAPLVLGFRDLCPTHGTEKLMRFFVNALADDWGRRHDRSHIKASWLKAAQTWGQPFGRRLAYLDEFGQAFHIPDAGSWAWEQV